MEKLNQSTSESGLVVAQHADELTGKLVTHSYQNISAGIAMATAMRNDESYWRQGVKRGMAHAAHIPEVVIVELMNLGINVYQAPAKEIIAGIKRLGKEYLLTTSKQV